MGRKKENKFSCRIIIRVLIQVLEAEGIIRIHRIQIEVIEVDRIRV